MKENRWIWMVSHQKIIFFWANSYLTLFNNWFSSCIIALDRKMLLRSIFNRIFIFGFHKMTIILKSHFWSSFIFVRQLSYSIYVNDSLVVRHEYSNPKFEFAWNEPFFCGKKNSKDHKKIVLGSRTAGNNGANVAFTSTFFRA